MKLRGVLEPVVASGGYRVIIIDCPPALGMLSMNSLAAADYLLITLQCEYMALEGLGQILRNVERLKTAGINPALELGGIVMTMFDVRTSLSRQVVEEVKTAHARQDLRVGDPEDRAPERGPELRQDDLRLRPHRAPEPPPTATSPPRWSTRFAPMTKYGQAFLVGLQSNLVYRWNFAVRSVFWFFHLVVVFILWGAAFAGTPSIGGYSLRADAHVLRRDLRPPVLHRRLQRGLPDQRGHPQRPDQPVPAQADQLLRLPPERLRGRPGRLGRLRAPGAARRRCPSSGATWTCPTTPGGSRSACPRMALTAIIQFSIAYCFGLLAFWFLEIQGFVILSMAVETLLGGQIVPARPPAPGGLQRRALPAVLLPDVLSRRPSSPAGRALILRCRAWRSRHSGPSSWSALPRWCGGAACATTPPPEAESRDR